MDPKYFMNSAQNQTDSSEYFYFDRDISWLSFNERVLAEAENEHVPPLERLNFLAIYSSNLDEFFRVRMPALKALARLVEKEKVTKEKAEGAPTVVDLAINKINTQLNKFGETLAHAIDALSKNNIHILYGKAIPELIVNECTQYFFNYILSFLKIHKEKFFAENNRLYMAVTTVTEGLGEQMLIIQIPSQEVPRFLKVEVDGITYFIFMDDIIKQNLFRIQKGVVGSFTFKVTRDAEIDLSEVYVEDMAEKIEAEIAKRHYGLATRLLHEPGIPQSTLLRLIGRTGLDSSVLFEGGQYHNLSDLATINVERPSLKYDSWPPISKRPNHDGLLLDTILKEEFFIHTPYHAYEPVLRFFNEAANVEDVTHIYITMYRVARESRILNALLSALHNGKKVTIVIELKARFDEANNLKWAKRLRKAGAEVIYTDTALKVHAKIALVKRKSGSHKTLVGLLATGNFNEQTAKIYSDHVLFTGDIRLLGEAERLLKSVRQNKFQGMTFEHLLVGRNNLKEELITMINRESTNAEQGLPARITLKLNALEDRKLINKLYQASSAGVKINLLVRGICCLVPGVIGMSENITVKRIVDRYLEHGRVYIFHNNGNSQMYLGSADWMSRNIYRRIEVCFPIYDENLRDEITRLIDIQFSDNIQAVQLDEKLINKKIDFEGVAVQSQRIIYKTLAAGSLQKAAGT